MRIFTPLLLCSALLAADPALTIYNQNFAVVRETIPLDLQQGATSVKFVGTTAHLEPESVILRDPSGRRTLQILEQSYRADPVSAEMLLSLFEGQTIDFLVTNRDTTQIVSGKIIRSGYTPRPLTPYGPSATGNSPIVEVDGKLRFQLPGAPLFPKLADDTILKPTIEWTIQSDAAGKFDAELGYVTGQLSWDADYNIISPVTGDALEVIGWVTMSNESGKTFENARIKLMAGDVNKIRPRETAKFMAQAGMGGVVGGIPGGVPVTEKTFDEYHLYSLQRPTTLHDRETKQVEFVRAAGVKSKIIYIYDGAKIDPNRYRGWPAENIRNDSSYGTESNPKVWVMREFQNSDANHLGMPLPRGRVRFYRRDGDGRLEFTGEDAIDHTPHDETISTFTGSSFDLVGERRRVTFRIDHQRSMLDESFEIKVRNHKKEPAEVRVVEHLYRGTSWEIPTSSISFTKKDSQNVEFQIPLAADQEKILTYTVHYTW